MANLETETSTSKTLGGEYQVFLSFRGPDTRHTFTDMLHRALVDVSIRVFIDDKGLRPGERISGNLPQAIDNSKLYIPIFSKDYASSHWCLDELVRMVENASKRIDGKEKIILPIFYDVKPNDVKLETALYEDAMSNLERKMDHQKHKLSSEDGKKWRKALKDVGDITGWELVRYSSPGELIEAVVGEVLARLKTRKRRPTRDFVGMEDRIAHIKKLLDINSGGVRLIGIYGMGGIGKTTIAKKIFNKLCTRFGRNCSFLDDVRETINSKGLVELQKNLLSDISNSKVARNIANSDHGIDTIEEAIYNKKVLIVLDNIDDASQIKQLIGEESLYSGTRILVTTRDKSVLDIRGFKYKFMEYEMMGLSFKDALTLFSRHAFNDDSPPDDYCSISEDIVYTTYGLPLALEAIGSSLYRKSRAIWEESLEKLKKKPHWNVLEKLRISYDALEPTEQEIFLDIACFFVGENKTNPMYMWKDCKFYPEGAIDVLINRCMIKVLDDNCLWMHDQFRDLGRKIANFRDLGREIANHTRLWDRDDTIHELGSKEIKTSVQALRLSADHMIVNSEQINRFPHIRFLRFHNVNCQGDFTDCLYELKWINLSYSCSIAMGIGMSIQCLEATNLLHLKNVVVVNLSGLDITEDMFEDLIKGATKLKVLTINYNKSIHGTPTFPKYSDLERLTMSEFSSLMEIDCSIGNLTKLTYLSFDSCWELKKLPEQIGELQRLQYLSLKICQSFIDLPDSVSKLGSLNTLDVSFTLIQKLPNTMSRLLQLQTLCMNNCDRIQELPKLPRSLTTLQLTSASLLTIPNLSYLTNLVELTLSDDSESMARSDKIQTCNLQWIASLSKLSKLYFCFSNVSAPTTELGSFSLLKELTLHGLNVPNFEQLPSKLIVLELYDTRGKKVWLPPPEKETAIVSPSSSELKEDKALQQIELKFISSHKSSEGLVHLRDEAGCNELQAPELIDHWRGAFYFPSSLDMLQKFVLWGCPGVQDIQFVSTLESLLVFSVGGCISLESLGGLSNLKNLMELTLNRCWSLRVVEGIDELEFLHQLKIDQCESVERILDPVKSKIPDKCSILITQSGDLPDCDRTYDTWKSYRARILQGKREAYDFYF